MYVMDGPLYKILIKKHAGKTQLGRPRHRWKNRNRMSL
jgi:hypothetical protein